MNQNSHLSLPLFSESIARQLRDQGIAAVSSYPNDDYITKARAVAEILAAKQGSVTINDVLKICPRPENVHPNAIGAIMRSKHLKLISFVHSDKISAHARRIGVYEYTK